MPDLPDYSRSRAILIGTASYRDPGFLPLPAAANSLAGMRQVLTDPDLCGWPDDQVTVLEDPTDMAHLVRTLRRLARGTEDVLLVYFVGHGVILPRGQLCLVLADTDPEHADVTGLEYQRVRDVIRDSPARVKVAVLDCCYSGRVIEALSAATEIADSTDTRGVYTLTASDHTAHVVPLDRQMDTTTSFTGELLDLVRDGIPDGPQRLTLGTLYVHLRRRLDVRGLPAPNQRGTDTADRFSFTRNAAHHPQPPPPPPSQPPESRPPAELDAETEDEDLHGPTLHEQPYVDAGEVTSSAAVSESAGGDAAEADQPDTTAPAPGRGVRRRTVLLGGLAAAAVAGGVPTAIVLSRAGDNANGAEQPDEVWSVLFSPNGRTLATASYLDPVVLFWDVETGRKTATLNAPDDASGVFSMAFSPNGKTLATAHADNSIRLWDVATLHGTKTLTGHTQELSTDPIVTGSSAVRAVAFSPNGEILASGGVDHTVRLWNVATGRNTVTITDHTDEISSVAFSPNGKTLASSSFDHTVGLWDATTGRPISKRSADLGSTATAVAFIPGGKTLAILPTGLTSVMLRDMATGRTTTFFTGNNSGVFAVAVSPDGKTLATGDAEGTTLLSDLATARTTATLTGHTKYKSVTAVAFSPDGKTLATSSRDGTARLWNVATSSTTFTLPGPTPTRS